VRALPSEGDQGMVRGAGVISRGFVTLGSALVAGVVSSDIDRRSQKQVIGAGCDEIPRCARNDGGCRPLDVRKLVYAGARL
jgi:hypothetical protein